MKLSLICPIYKQPKQFERFLETISRQENQDFELILVIDSNTKEELDILERFKNKIKAPIKLVYNLKRVGRTRAIVQGARIAVGDYMYISTITDVFYDDATKRMLNLIEKKANADIIEFQARIRTPIFFQGRQRKIFSETVNIAENPDVIAYTYPFDFNKIYKNNVFKKAIESSPVKGPNSRFAISFVMLAFKYAKTYSNENIKITRCKSEFDEDANTLLVMREWKNFLDNESKIDNSSFVSEFQYLMLFGITMFLVPFTHTTKNKMLIDKLNQAIVKEKKLYETLVNANKYMLLQNEETKVMRESNTHAEMAKMYKKMSYA